MIRTLFLCLLPFVLQGQLQTRSHYLIADTITNFGQRIGSYTLIISAREQLLWLTLEDGEANESLEDIQKKNMTGSNTLADLSFDSDRAMVNMWYNGLNVGGSTLRDPLEYLYTSFPTLSLSIDPSTLIYEIGDSEDIDFIITTSSSSGSVLSQGGLYLTSETPDYLMLDFADATSSTFRITYEPEKGGTGRYHEPLHSVRAQQYYVKGSYSGWIYSSTINLQAVYPVFWGVSETDYSGSSGTELYDIAEFEKELWTRSDRSVTFLGTGYAYFIVPQENIAWVVTEILDHNGFPITSFDFIPVVITKSGEWSDVNYTMIKATNLAGYDNYVFQFNL